MGVRILTEKATHLDLADIFTRSKCIGAFGRVGLATVTMEAAEREVQVVESTTLVTHSGARGLLSPGSDLRCRESRLFLMIGL